MKFNSIKEAKKAYLEGYELVKKASAQGNVKINNKTILNQINPAFEYLKKNNKLKILVEFLEQNNDIDLKQSVAVALLPYYEDIAINALEEISVRKDLAFQSFKAKMVLKQWKKESF